MRSLHWTRKNLKETLQSSSLVGSDGKDRAQQVQGRIHKANDSSCKAGVVVLPSFVVLQLDQKHNTGSQ